MVIPKSAKFGICVLITIIPIFCGIIISTDFKDKYFWPFVFPYMCISFFILMMLARKEHKEYRKKQKFDFNKLREFERETGLDQ